MASVAGPCERLAGVLTREPTTATLSVRFRLGSTDHNPTWHSTVPHILAKWIVALYEMITPCGVANRQSFVKNVI